MNEGATGSFEANFNHHKIFSDHDETELDQHLVTSAKSYRGLFTRDARQIAFLLLKIEFHCPSPLPGWKMRRTEKPDTDSDFDEAIGSDDSEPEPSLTDFLLSEVSIGSFVSAEFAKKSPYCVRCWRGGGSVSCAAGVQLHEMQQDVFNQCIASGDDDDDTCDVSQQDIVRCLPEAAPSGGTARARTTYLFPWDTSTNHPK